MSITTCPNHPNYVKHNCPNCNSSNDTLTVHISASIERYRERAGLSIRDVAKALKITPNLYGQYESGRTLPKHIYLYKLACIFGCSVAAFYPKPKPARISETEIEIKRKKRIKVITL